MIADTNSCSASPPEHERALSSGGATILVADDNRTNRMLTTKILERAGHRVEAVGDGEAAVGALARGTFDLAILELELPGMSGLDVAKLHRLAFVGRRRIPIVIMASDASPEAIGAHAADGIDAWLAKPVQPKQLLDLVAELTSRAEAPGPAVSDYDTVKTLAGHPRFRTAPALDSRTLADLHALGGAAFVSELVEGFLSDTDDVLRALRQASACGDVDTFRDQLHALRSGAANIGAQEIYALCLTWRQIEPAELESRGMGYVDRLAAELERARADLRRHVAETAEGEVASEIPGSLPRHAGSGAA